MVERLTAFALLDTITMEVAYPNVCSDVVLDARILRAKGLFRWRHYVLCWWRRRN